MQLIDKTFGIGNKFVCTQVEKNTFKFGNVIFISSTIII